MKYLLASAFLGVTAVVSLLLLWSDSSTRASSTTEGLTANTSSPTEQKWTPTGSGKVAPEVIDALSSASSVSVIVSLAGRPAPGAVASPVDVAALADSVAASAARVLASVPPSEFELAQQYQAVPALGGDVTMAGVWALAAHPDVVHVGLDFEVRATLAQAVPLIGADDVHNLLGRTGAGVVVAVLDSGIDTDHPLLLDDLNHQQCFLSSGTCPGGGITGLSAEDGDGHGSHVSGIITSAGPPVGVAPDALIDAFKVLDDSGTGTFANVIAAYDEIILNHPEVDIINMSLGDRGSHSPGTCEKIIPALTTAIGTTRAMGITTFASSGNNGSKSGIGYPACIKDIVSVGAVYDADVGVQDWFSCTDATTAADQVVCFSQSNISLDLLAPGSRIDSTVSGGGFDNYSGTSMASPAAAASAALLLESEPLLTPADVETRLTETGVPVTDAGNGVTTCRVDVYEAVLNDGGSICPSVGPPPPPPPNDDLVNAYAVSEPLPYTNAQLTTSSTTEVSEPSPCAGIASTVWYSFTPSSSNTITVDTFGSDYDTVLAIHTGPSVGSLTLVGCNDDTAGLQSQVQFSATGGTTYHIQVGGYFGFAGSLTLNTAPALTCPDIPTFSFSVPDPVEDSFGYGSPNHDITSVDGEGDDSIFCLTVGFAGPVDPADAGSGQEVAGLIEFDTDQNVGTGYGSYIDNFCDHPSGMRAEEYLDIGSVSGGFGLLSGTPVPVTFGATSFTAVIPLSLIGGDPAFNFGMLVGSFSELTDCAPGNGGCIESPAGTVCPILEEMALDVIAGGSCAGGVCYVAPGATFTLAVDAVTAPAAGYLGIRTFIDFGVYNPTASEDGAGPNSCSDSIDNGVDGKADRFDADCVTVDLVYKPAAQISDEITWPDQASGYVLRHQPGPGLVRHTSYHDPRGPDPISTFEGNIVSVQMTCPSSPTQVTITLLPQNGPIATSVGSGFIVSNPGYYLFFLAPNVGSLTINCMVPPTPTPTVTPTPTPVPPDTDGDGCSDVKESGPDETLGGLRDPTNPWDFYDVAGISGATPDGYIDLLFDVLGVIQHYSPQGDPPYDAHYDRGPTAGPNPWNMTAPDGVIDLLNDILGVIQQHAHDCR